MCPNENGKRITELLGFILQFGLGLCYLRLYFCDLGLQTGDGCAEGGLFTLVKCCCLW